MLDNFIYWATAPIRLFGQSRAFRLGLVGVVVLGQLPSRLDLIGIALVMFGVALHREVTDGPGPAR